MRWYKAKICGFKKSKNTPGCCYPVFEYEDKYGEVRMYTRKHPLEQTPFSFEKTYTICKKDYTTYEASEKKLKPRVYLLALRIILWTVALVAPYLAVWTLITNLGIQIGRRVASYFKQYSISSSRDRMIQLDGVIVGYKKIRKDHLFVEPDTLYLPLTQYEYEGRAYVHIGKVACKKEQRTKGAICRVYIDAKKQLVIDEFEINAPLIDTKKLSAESIQATYSKIVRRTQEMQKNREAQRQKEAMKREPLGMSPLRSNIYKRAVNW